MNSELTHQAPSGAAMQDVHLLSEEELLSIAGGLGPFGMGLAFAAGGLGAAVAGAAIGLMLYYYLN